MAKAARGKGRKKRPAAKRAQARPGRIWPWLVTGVAAVAGIFAYDRLDVGLPVKAGVAAFVAPVRVPVRPVAVEPTVTAAIPRLAAPRRGVPTPDDRPAEQLLPERAAAAPKFFYCTDLKNDCVIDGSTFWYGGEKIRVADIDVPQSRKAKCEDERKRGSLAKGRLLDLLNRGAFSLVALKGRADASPEKLRVVLRDGRSIGDQMVRDGLARTWSADRKPWC